MKVGVRKPNLKKSLKARTTGKAKRQLKKAVIPGYGKKGVGWVKNPKKAAYNKVYNKVTVDPLKPLKNSSKRKGSVTKSNSSTLKDTYQNPGPVIKEKKGSILMKIISAMFFITAISALTMDEDLLTKIGSVLFCILIGKWLWEKSKPVIEVEIDYKDIDNFDIDSIEAEHNKAAFDEEKY